MNRMRLLTIVCAVTGLLAPAAQARIKLAALPARERVEIQLDHGRYTLVEEERIIPLLESTDKTGNNMIDFSWSNTAVDKDSIQFRPVGISDGDKFRPIKTEKGQDEVSVINVAYPPNENALVWEVYSAKSAAVKVRVSYLINNLARTFSYRAVATKDEKTLMLRNFLKLHNFSGEEFGRAGLWAGFGKPFEKEVGQQEEIEMLLEQFDKVAVDKTFTFDWYANGQLNPDKPFASKVVMHYKLLNDKEHGLGAFPLQPGKVRIFIDDGHGGEAFLGEDMAALTPLDDKMKLYLGEARDVVCTRTIENKDGNVRHPVRGNLFDQELLIKYEIENFKDTPVTLDIIEQINRLAQQYGTDPHGEAEWEKGPKTSQEITIDYPEGRSVPVLHVKLPARPKDKDAKVEKVVVRFHVTIKNLW